ncbi:MAG: glycosyltransferase family 39 protein [Caulobacteraceae bacterium]
MSLEDRLDAFGRGWRGPALAAAVALAAGLPGLLALPPLDRDEARFAEASAQMLESGDFVSIHFQGQPRFKKPVGVYWLQAAAVSTLSHVEDRDIWAYRVPSLIGAMLAAAACAWGAAAFLAPGAALAAGSMLGASFILATEAGIAATDGVLCGAVTLAMAAMARIYVRADQPCPAGWPTRTLFWAGLSLAVLVKGPIGPMVALLAMVALVAWDRRAAWLGRMGWGWGLILMAVVIGPWAMAITVATDGAFWSAAVGGDLAPKLAGSAEGHGAPPGYYGLLVPLLIFPATLLLPAGLVAGWRARAEPGVRFALCWLVPAWLVFEAVPTKLVHYTLPLYGAVAWLMACALARPPGRIAAWSGAALSLLAACAFAAVGPLAMSSLGDWSGAGWALLAGALFLGAGGAGAALILRRRSRRALLVAGALALAGHAVLAAGVAPALGPLWLTDRTADALAESGGDPRDGIVSGPVTVAGFAEPSLVFLLGADTRLGDGSDAAEAIAQGRPAIVESRDDAAFRNALVAQATRARIVAAIPGLDYSNGRHDILRIYLPLGAATAPHPPDAKR